MNQTNQNGQQRGRRGGKRAGAGRKKKVRAATAIDPADVQMLLGATPEPDFIETIAQRHARVSIEALVKKLVVGSNEAARVKAANQILDRGFGRPGVGIGG